MYRPSILLLLGLPLGSPSWGAVTTQVTAPSGVHGAFAPRRVALVVGVEHYADAALGDLQFTGDDAAALAATLQDDTVGAFDTVHLLQGHVSTDAFWRAWDETLGDVQAEDLVVVYFAGHGTLDMDRSTRLYLLFSDADLDAPEATGVGLADLEDALQAVPSRHRVLILDSCYSGTGRSAWSSTTREAASRLRGTPPVPTRRPPRRLDAELFAAHLHQPAMEDPALGHGIYTWFLLEALSGAGDLDGDGLVDVWEAHEHAVLGTIRHTGGAQTPWVRVSQVGADNVYLAGDEDHRRAAEKAIVHGSLGTGATLRLDGTPYDGLAAVDPGWHFLEVTEADGTLVLERTLLLRRGARLDVDGILASRGKWEAGAGAGATMGSETTPPFRGHVDLWRWVSREENSRVGLGGQASVGGGRVAAQAPSLQGDALVRLA